MNQAEALRRVMEELGDVSAEELVAFMHKTYGVTVRPQFIPVVKATLKDQEILAEWRRKSQEAAAQGNGPASVDGQGQPGVA